MARNHRGFVEALIAANRIGADVLLLNTSFAGPALAEVLQREGEGNRRGHLRRGVHRDGRPGAGRAVPRPPGSSAWTDSRRLDDAPLTVEQLIDRSRGRRARARQRARRESSC